MNKQSTKGVPTGKEEEIAGLLSQGITPSELVKQGYSRGTVYKVSRRVKQTESASSEDSPATDAVIEADPEIIQLKKDLRKAELRRQLDIMEVPPEVETLLVVARDHGEDRRDDCPMKESGFCSYWEWSSPDEIPKGIGEVVAENKNTWRINPSHFYCAMCVAPLDSNIGDLANDLSTLEEKLDSTPLVGLRERFVCECGSERMLAVSIKCTKCEQEFWWGWFPKREK